MVAGLNARAIVGTNVSTTVETVRPPHGLRLKSDHIRVWSSLQMRLRAARGSRREVLRVVEQQNLGERKALAAPFGWSGLFCFCPCSKGTRNREFPQGGEGRHE